MRVRMRFPMIWLAFRRRFGSKIDEKSTLDLEGLAKRKTLQNIGRGSKNQGSSFQKIIEKCLQKRFRRQLRKNRPKKSEKYDFRSPWGSFGKPKTDVSRTLLRNFSMLVLRRHVNHCDSSQVSGAWSFATVSLVFQRIRSALSV